MESVLKVIDRQHGNDMPSVMERKGKERNEEIMGNFRGGCFRGDCFGDDRFRSDLFDRMRR